MVALSNCSHRLFQPSNPGACRGAGRSDAHQCDAALMGPSRGILAGAFVQDLPRALRPPVPLLFDRITVPPNLFDSPAMICTTASSEFKRLTWLAAPAGFPCNGSRTSLFW